MNQVRPSTLLSCAPEAAIVHVRLLSIEGDLEFFPMDGVFPVKDYFLQRP